MAANHSMPSSPCKIFLLPSLFTAGNLFFGFLAIIRCIQARYGIGDSGVPATEFYTQAVWFILLAFLCDGLDGRVARLQGQDSLFGKEFDSIADIVSFGVAPALMMFFLILSPTEGFPFFRQVGWLIGFIYLLCCAVRLARFNVITHPLLPAEQRLTSTSDFQGLPVPPAACLISSLVLVLIKVDYAFIWLSMPALMLLIAWLMVSKIPYPSFKNIDFSTQARFRTFLAVAIIIACLFLFKEFSFAIISLSYIFYGLIRHISFKLKMKTFRKPK